jgi:hypothetical protein
MHCSVAGSQVPFPSLLDRVCFSDEMSRSNGPFKPPVCKSHLPTAAPLPLTGVLGVPIEYPVQTPEFQNVPWRGVSPLPFPFHTRPIGLPPLFPRARAHALWHISLQHLRPLGHTLSDEQKRAAVAKQRKLESLKMRKLYLTGVGPGGGSAKASTHATDMAEPNFHGPSSAGTLGASNAFSDSGGQKRWSAAERPADTEEDLVQWTKELSFDDYHDQWEQRARMQ